jgi:hypothetical protein
MERRVFFLCLLSFLMFAEGVSWFTAGGLGPCLIEQAAHNNEHEDCPTFFAGSLLAFERGFDWIKRDDNDKAVVAGFTIVLAISTIGLWLATNNLWEAGERQLELLAKTSAAQTRDMEASINAANEANQLNRQNASADRRPWLAITNIDVHLMKPSSGGMLDITFSYSVENFGKTPATRVRPRYMPRDYIEFDEMLKVAEELDAGHRAAKDYRAGMTVWPGQVLTIKTIMVGIQISQKSLEEGIAYPSLFINILYDSDGFEEPRQTREVYRLHTGNHEKHGLTTEFVHGGIILQTFSPATPVSWVSINSVNEAAKVT